MHCIGREVPNRQELFYPLYLTQTATGLSTPRITDEHIVLKNGRAVRIATYRPEDKEALVSMYASMSPEAIKWGLPPYDRARIERWTSDLTNNTSLLARL